MVVSEKKLLTVADFCQRYSVGRTRAYALIRTGKIKAVKNGSSTRIVAESAEAWAASLPAIAPDEDADGDG
jgi:excisionase family DNA binding protein